MEPLDIALWCVTDLCAAAALVRLIATGLVRRYPAFTCMLSTAIVRDVILSFCRRDVFIPWSGMHLYTLAWVLTLIPALLTQAAAALECYRMISEQYPRIGPFASWLFGVCLAISAALCAAGLRVETAHLSGAEATFRFFILAMHWQTGLESGALTLATAFLALFPPPMRRLPRNVSIHTFQLAAYFGAYALTTWLKNALPAAGALQIERGLFVLVSCLYLMWAARLSGAGEEKTRWPGLDPKIVGYIHRREELARQLLQRAAKASGERR